MGINKNKQLPLSRKPFDLQEAVVLLDVYLSEVKNGSSLTKAAKIASGRLHALAENKGYIFEDSFRSPTGLINRLRSIGSLYEGTEAKGAPGTVVFAEALNIYRKDQKRYDELLMASKENMQPINTAAKVKTLKSVRDQKMESPHDDSIKLVYYALKNITRSGKTSATIMDVFAVLEEKVLMKDVETILTEARWSRQVKSGYYTFYDKEQEDRRQKQMEGKQSTDELEFFKWLPSIVAPFKLEEIRKSYLQINTILIKNRVLMKPLTDVLVTGPIEDALKQINKCFANKKLRATAIVLLTAYHSYLEEIKNTVPLEKLQPEIEVQDDWIKFDFNNSRDFERTVPVYCCVNGIVIEGKNWARILVGITEREIAKDNPALAELYKVSLLAQRKARPFILKEKIDGLHCAQLSNGYWINVNYNIPRLMEQIRALCLHCGYQREQIDIYGITKGKAPSHVDKTISSQSGYGVSIEKAEEYLRSKNLQGATVKEVIDAVQPGAVVSSTIKALEESLNIISMPGNRYVHVDSFVDLDEAEEELGNILKMHFIQFGGYSNNQLLFGAASRDLSMFLNDNDCENIEAVFSIARFLFEKKKVAGKPYKFYSPHIFEVEPDFPMTLRGLMINLARSNGGVLIADEAKNYLHKTMLTYGGMGQLLQIGSANTFLVYDSDRYLLSEKLGIDDAWCSNIHERMDDLFRKANVAYVIPRDISTSWLNTLPALPHGLAWTHLLLQEVLDKYPAIGFKSISPDLSQAHDTLSAAFVPLDSPLQSFPDVVTLFMEERHALPVRMDGEELRIELRDAGMLQAGEMIYALPKALDDYRFAWSNENKTVYVRGN